MFISSKLTVLFDDPFWIGIFEVQDGESYKVCKVTFGGEPKEIEILNFLLKKYYGLSFFNEEIQNVESFKNNINPKRMQRNIKKSLTSKKIGTKAQIALKKQHEVKKEENKNLNKKKKEQEEIRKYKIKQQKKKDKHRGH